MSEIEHYQAGQVAVTQEMTIEQLIGQVSLIQAAMEHVMHDGEHYGVIPGTDKPSLLKPGAEKLLLLFRLAADYDNEMFYQGDHLTVVSTCRLTHIPSGQHFGSAVGMCSTKESKYAWRSAKPTCPACGAEAILRSKYKPRPGDYEGASRDDPPGWYCFQKQGGCGANFAHDNLAITEQPRGKVLNDALPDLYNTVLKMAEKRALTAAALNATAASDIFTQDVEDLNLGGDGGATTGAPQLDDTTAASLHAALESVSEWGELWAPDVVLANAVRRFGRPLASLRDLSASEAEQIIQAAYHFKEQQMLNDLAQLDGDLIEAEAPPLAGYEPPLIDEQIGFGDEPEAVQVVARAQAAQARRKTVKTPEQD